MSTNDSIGTDLTFDLTTGDLVQEKDDLSIISGNENLLQAVLLRFLTALGSLPLAPDFGSKLHKLIGKGSGSINETIAHFLIGEALIKEPRIAGVERIDPEYTDDVLTVTIGVVPIDSEEVITTSLTLNV